MSGFINSPMQVEIIKFIDRVGPCPAQVLVDKYGDKAMRHLAVLRSAQYLYNLTLDGIDWWIPQGYGRFNQQKQKKFLDFVLWLESAGGEYRDGVAALDHQEFNITWQGKNMVLTDLKTGREYSPEDIKSRNTDTDPAQTQPAANDYGELFRRLTEINATIRAGVDDTTRAELEQELHEIKSQMSALRGV